MSSEVVYTKGNLEYRKRSIGGNRYEIVPILTHCPVCGYEFEGGCSRSAHIGGHSPADFNL